MSRKSHDEELKDSDLCTLHSNFCGICIAGYLTT